VTNARVRPGAAAAPEWMYSKPAMAAASAVTVI
jgi:hypothetical protein